MLNESVLRHTPEKNKKSRGGRREEVRSVKGRWYCCFFVRLVVFFAFEFGGLKKGFKSW
jgi:hypothetical protein